MEDISTEKLKPCSVVSWRVYDLLRRYELQCATNQGLESNSVFAASPYDFTLLERRFNQLSGSESDDFVACNSQWETFKLFSDVQKKVGFAPSRSRGIGLAPLPSGGFGPDKMDPALQLICWGISGANHYSEMFWLPQFSISFSFDSLPGLHEQKVRLTHAVFQHLACSAIELVFKNTSTGIARQPTEGSDTNVCAFSATLFLQLVLRLFADHGPTATFVQKLRELEVDESHYAKRRKQAAKDINEQMRTYGRLQQELRMQQAKAAKVKEKGQPN
jgi:hypothetical protein